jgi:hypothetical protein
MFHSSHSNIPYFLIEFPQKLFFFEFRNYRKIKIVAANFNLLDNKLNFCCGNYSRAETI